MYDLFSGYTVGDENDDLTPAERRQLQTRTEADVQLSVQSGGSRAAARWTEEVTVSSGAKPAPKQRSEKLPNPIPSKVPPPSNQKRSSKEQESVPTASSSHRADSSRKSSTNVPPSTQKHLSMKPKPASIATSSHHTEPSRKSSTKSLPPTQMCQVMEPERVPPASSTSRPQSSRITSTKVPKSAPMVVDSGSGVVIPPPTRKESMASAKKADSQSSVLRKAPQASRKTSTKVPKSAPMVVDSDSDSGSGMVIPPPTRKESMASAKKADSQSSVLRKAPDRTSSSKPQRPAPVDITSEMDDRGAPSNALNSDLKQAVLSDIQAIVARHMARAARADHEALGGKVNEESEDDGDIVMGDGNQDESSSSEEIAMQESPQIPHMSEKQKGKQREVDSASGSLDDVEMINDELTGLNESHHVGDLSTSSGFLSVDNQSFYEDREYDDGDLGVVQTLDDGTGPSPWTTDGSVSRPETPQDVDDGPSSNEHAPRTPQAGQRRDRQFFSGTSHSFSQLSFQ